MQWKKRLRKLEYEKKWDEAIAFMQQVIKDNPSNMDAYLFMNFLLMNLLVEEDHDESKHDYYESLAKKYFNESYAKFSGNAEYLYLTGKTAVMSEWYFGIDVKDYEDMFERARQLEPKNPLYNKKYYYMLRNKDPKHPELIAHARMILSENSPVKEQLKDKGMLGEYILGMEENWSKDVLWEAFDKAQA